LALVESGIGSTNISRESAERLEQSYREIQGEVERLTAELGESWQETQQLRGELEQVRGFFRRRRPGRIDGPRGSRGLLKGALGFRCRVREPRRDNARP
jgi:hypothetical protein